MAASLKEISETLRNLTMAGAVIVSGVWVYYQWDTLFPKTQAEVSAAAATVVADVSGRLDVSLAAPPADLSLSSACSASSDNLAHLQIPLLARISIESAAAVPVLIRPMTLDISRYRPGAVTVAAGLPDATHAAIGRDGTWANITHESVLGGPTRVLDVGQSAQIDILVRGNFAVDCTDPEPSLYAVTLAFSAEPFDRVTATGQKDQWTGHAFTDLCRIAPDGRSDCEITGLSVAK